MPVDPRTVLIEAGLRRCSRTDGRYVVFSHTGMLGVGVYPISNVWLRDLRTNRLELISADYQGNPSTVFGLRSSAVRVSADGRYVDVRHAKPNCPVRTAVPSRDVYRLDRKTGSLVWITQSPGPDRPLGRPDRKLLARPSPPTDNTWPSTPTTADW